ncbi:hypothetical protein ACM26W_01200 [Halomonas sp. HK25]|uniref:hypothetical protein n=1 Tax=Halomonas sp. HK25 TaxID=3394321 RepID=UPI0039FBF36A
MKLHYIGPLCAGVSHPALAMLDPDCLPASCYLVEVSDEAGVEGPLIEGDVLVVDEARPIQHGNLVVMAVEGQCRLFNSHRIGGGFLLLPTVGPRESIVAREEDCAGVVVRQVRMQAA